MKKYIYAILSVAILSGFIVSCRKTEAEILTPSNQMDYRLPSEQFLAIWNSMNTSYSMWDLEDKDWTAVKNEFMPEFLALDDSVNADFNISTSHLKDLYTEILGDLKDHHAGFKIWNIWASDTDEGYFSVDPSSIEIKKRDYYHPKHIWSQYINYFLADPNLADEYDIHSIKDLTMVSWLLKKKAEGRATEVHYGSTGYITVVSGLIDGNIPYIHISSFELGTLLNDASSATPSQSIRDCYEAYVTFKDNVLKLDGIKGVIIDLRENGGGYLNDEFYLLGLLIDEPVQAGWSRYKTGLGRYDYSTWVPHIFSPGPEHRGIDAPVVLVCDLYSVSMSEITTMLVKAMPNGCVLGERTYGGHGVISSDFEATYSGTFGSTSGNHYGYISTRTVKDFNGDILEGIGITPDIELNYADGVFKDGEDTWLERAVQYINEGN
ncbi:MAG: S41 family peptidase [Candidatus Cryptobacteroides sp.]